MDTLMVSITFENMVAKQCLPLVIFQLGFRKHIAGALGQLYCSTTSCALTADGVNLYQICHEGGTSSAMNPLLFCH